MSSRYRCRLDSKMCLKCGAALDPGEICDCYSGDYADNPTVAEKLHQPLLNVHGEYVLKFARNHNLSIAEAHQHPMVQAHLAWYNSQLDADKQRYFDHVQTLKGATL